MVKFKDNDIYALKIKDKDSKYYGKYIIIIKCSYEGYPKHINKGIFRFKLSKDKSIPKLEEVNNLEYIITQVQHELMKYMPLPGANVSFKDHKKKRDKIKVYPDEYGYLYSCISEIFPLNKNIPKDLIYIGNVVLDLPKYEYIPFSDYGYKGMFKWENIEKEIINCYELFNLEKSKMFSKEVAESRKREMLDLIEFHKKLEKIDFSKIKFADEEEIEDSLTYVGGEDKDPFK